MNRAPRPDAGRFEVRALNLSCFLVLVFLFTLIVPTRLSAENSEKDGQKEDVTCRVVDASGREVVLTGPARRIVVVGRGPFMALHLLYMFPEGRQRLAAYEEKLKGSNTFMPLLDTRFHRKIALATNPGPEQVAAMNPDLVIMKGTTPVPLGNALAVLGIPVVYLGMENPDMFVRDTLNLGILLGNRKRALQIMAFYQSRLNLLEERLKGLKEEVKPRVLVVEYSARGGKTAVRVPARSWIQTIQALTAGGRPVWLETTYGTDGWTITNFEQIAAWDPDKIFVIVWFTLEPGKVISSLYADPRWRMLKSVKNHELHAFPSDIFGWDSPDPRWILGMMWLAKMTHPDRFADRDIEEEIYRFFGELYDMDRAVVDASIIPATGIRGR